MSTDKQSRSTMLPQGWKEAPSGRMATNADPIHGGIIDSSFNGGKWFAVFNREGWGPIEGLNSRDEAFNAFFDRLSRDAMIEVLFAETHRMFRDSSGGGVIQYREGNTMVSFYSDAERHDGFCRRLTAAKFGEVESLTWARQWYDDLVLEARALMDNDFAQRVIKSDVERAKAEVAHAQLAQGLSGNPHVQAYLNTLEDPVSVKTHDYMAWIGDLTARYDVKRQSISWQEFLTVESEKQLSERVKLMRSSVQLESVDPRIALLSPGVQAEVHNDSHSMTVDFNAAAWFAQACDKDILELSKIGWRGDYAADAVAEYFESSNGDIAALFSYCRATHNTRRHEGFECSVNEDDAVKWLETHRPALLEKLACDEKINDIYLVLTISDTTSAAFKDLGRDNEIARIIETCARSFATTPLEVNDKYAVLDVNDRAVGVVALTDEAPSDGVTASQARLSIKVGQLDEGAVLPIEVRQSMLNAASQIREGEHAFTVYSGEPPNSTLRAKYECSGAALSLEANKDLTSKNKSEILASFGYAVEEVDGKFKAFIVQNPEAFSVVADDYDEVVMEAFMFLKNEVDPELGYVFPDVEDSSLDASSSVQ